MPINDTRLFCFEFLIKKIRFEQNYNTHKKFTANVRFLKYREQKLFEPVTCPPSNTLQLNTGRTFTFGLSRDVALAVAKQFMVYVSLQNTEPEKQLAEAQIDVTKSFGKVFKNPNIPRTQVC